jgi:hypothetical protein
MRFFPWALKPLEGIRAVGLVSGGKSPIPYGKLYFSGILGRMKLTQRGGWRRNSGSGVGIRSLKFGVWGLRSGVWGLGFGLFRGVHDDTLLRPATAAMAQLLACFPGDQLVASFPGDDQLMA